MTTIKLTPADLSALRQGKTIERTGGPTIKIVLSGEAVAALEEELNQDCSVCGNGPSI